MEIEKLKRQCQQARASMLEVKRRLLDMEAETREAIESADGPRILELKQQPLALHVELLQAANVHDAALKERVSAEYPVLEKAVAEAASEIEQAKRKRAQLDREINLMIREADGLIEDAIAAHKSAFAVYRSTMDQDVLENSEIHLKEKR